MEQGGGLHSYYYLMPGVTRATGKLGVNMFGDEASAMASLSDSEFNRHMQTPEAERRHREQRKEMERMRKVKEQEKKKRQRERLEQRKKRAIRDKNTNSNNAKIAPAPSNTKAFAETKK